MPPPPPGIVDLYVGNLDDSIDEAALKAFFDPYGKVVRCTIGMAQKKNKRKDFGFVGFESATEASKAIVEMNKKVKVVNGKALEVRLRETVQEKEKRIHLQDPKNWFPQSGGGSGSDGSWWSQNSYDWSGAPQGGSGRDGSWWSQNSYDWSGAPQGGSGCDGSWWSQNSYDWSGAPQGGSGRDGSWWSQNSYEWSGAPGSFVDLTVTEEDGSFENVKEEEEDAGSFDNVKEEEEEDADTPPQHEQKKSEVKQEPSSASRYRWQNAIEDKRARSAKTCLRYLLVNYLSFTHVRAQDHWSYKSEEVTDVDNSRYWTCTLHMFSFPTPSGLITHSWGWTQLQAEGYAAEQVLENAEVVDIQDNLADTMTQIKKKYSEHQIGRRQNESMRNYLTRVHSEQQFQGKRMAVFDGNI